MSRIQGRNVVDQTVNNMLPFVYQLFVVKKQVPTIDPITANVGTRRSLSTPFWRNVLDNCALEYAWWLNVGGNLPTNTKMCGTGLAPLLLLTPQGPHHKMRWQLVVESSLRGPTALHSQLRNFTSLGNMLIKQEWSPLGHSQITKLLVLELSKIKQIVS